jgi:hypothetical protein
MHKYDFALVLAGDLRLTDEVADALYAAGCDDGTPGESCGRFVIDFTREAESLEKAIATAIANVRQAGYEVEHVEIEAAAVSESAT